MKDGKESTLKGGSDPPFKVVCKNSNETFLVVGEGIEPITFQAVRPVSRGYKPQPLPKLPTIVITNLDNHPPLV